MRPYKKSFGFYTAAYGKYYRNTIYSSSYNHHKKNVAGNQNVHNPHITKCCPKSRTLPRQDPPPEPLQEQGHLRGPPTWPRHRRPGCEPLLGALPLLWCCLPVRLVFPHPVHRTPPPQPGSPQARGSRPGGSDGLEKQVCEEQVQPVRQVTASASLPIAATPEAQRSLGTRGA